MGLFGGISKPKNDGIVLTMINKNVTKIFIYRRIRTHRRKSAGKMPRRRRQRRRRRHIVGVVFVRWMKYTCKIVMVMLLPSYLVFFSRPATAIFSFSLSLSLSLSVNRYGLVKRPRLNKVAARAVVNGLMPISPQFSSMSFLGVVRLSIVNVNQLHVHSPRSLEKSSAMC